MVYAFGLSVAGVLTTMSTHQFPYRNFCIRIISATRLLNGHPEITSSARRLCLVVTRSLGISLVPYLSTDERGLVHSSKWCRRVPTSREQQRYLSSTRNEPKDR